MTTRKTKAEPELKPDTIMMIGDDLALIEAVTQIGAALVARHGVMKPTPTEADLIASAALIYAHALLGKARG